MASSRPRVVNSLDRYRDKRDFTVTGEPPAGSRAGASADPIFVVQKHNAARAGLHYDFRLEHDGVLWSWAVPKGPSLDPADKRMAIHVEDHPLDYAKFQGDIPKGQYGAGHVETWDTGTWTALDDPEAGMRKGHIHFELHGGRLNGTFSLVRAKRRGSSKSEAWFLIKGKDDAVREGADAAVVEQRARSRDASPAPGAVPGKLPAKPAPQLCQTAEDPPDGDDWISEVKFDGYRLIAVISNGDVRLLTRNGHDWADRLPSLAKAFARLPLHDAVIDGEMVSLRPDGVSSFPDLQAALSAGQDAKLHFYAFDLLYIDGWDLQKCRLLDRKAALAGLLGNRGTIRFSEHHQGHSREMRRNACRMHLEGLIFKRADAPYRSGRGSSWVKVKCQGREELVVLGWTPPAGTRQGIGALHLGYYDPQGALHYAGAVGTGFSDAELKRLRSILNGLAADEPENLQVAGEKLDRAIRWVRPERVAEISFTDWSGSGRVRHGVYLGLREDKTPGDVVRAIADPEAERNRSASSKPHVTAALPKPKRSVETKPADSDDAKPATKSRIVMAQAPKSNAALIAGVRLSHPGRELWPGITKQELAEYWQAVAEFALPGIARRPLAVLRCPDGIDGNERFFQKHGHGIMPDAIREGMASKQPYLAIDDVEGLVSFAQMSAIELHTWGSTEDDPTHPDRLVFDLDPGEGVPFTTVVDAALEVRERLRRLGLVSFCRTSGGKGLHVVVPLQPDAGWDKVKPFCRAFAEAMAADLPDRFVAHVKIADRKHRILIDWLRNGLGATAIASFSPRARPGAMVATPLSWREVTAKLDPSSFTMRSVPVRLSKLQADPWAGFSHCDQHLPAVLKATLPAKASPQAEPAQVRKRAGSSIVEARAPRKRS